MKDSNKNKDSSDAGIVGGITVIGERGQVVIPQEIRKRLNLKKGSKFIVIEHLGKIALLPERAVGDMIEHLNILKKYHNK